MLSKAPFKVPAALVTVDGFAKPMPASIEGREHMREQCLSLHVPGSPQCYYTKPIVWAVLAITRKGEVGKWGKSGDGALFPRSTKKRSPQFLPLPAHPYRLPRLPGTTCRSLSQHARNFTALLSECPRCITLKGRGAESGGVVYADSCACVHYCWQPPGSATQSGE